MGDPLSGLYCALLISVGDLLALDPTKQGELCMMEIGGPERSPKREPPNPASLPAEQGTGADTSAIGGALMYE